MTCSLCGKKLKDVDLMVTGNDHAICSFCITYACEILMERVRTNGIKGLSHSEVGTINTEFIKP